MKLFCPVLSNARDGYYLHSLAIITGSASILYVFTERELEILAELVSEVMGEEEYEEAWHPADREVMNNLALKLTPEVQSEINELELRLAAVPDEGEQSEDTEG